MKFDQRMNDGALKNIQDCHEYGILSAFLTESSNKKNCINHWILFDDLVNLGYSPIQSSGIWDFHMELCWTVPHINLEELLILAEKYGQEAVMYANAYILDFSECLYKI